MLIGAHVFPRTPAVADTGRWRPFWIPASAKEVLEQAGAVEGVDLELDPVGGLDCAFAAPLPLI